MPGAEGEGVEGHGDAAEQQEQEREEEAGARWLEDYGLAGRSRELGALARQPEGVMTEQVDVVVLGVGTGGEDLALSLAEAGLDVVGIEGSLLGGECPYWACIPSKMMIRAANMLQEARRIDGMAGHAEVTPDWAPVAARIRAEATGDWETLLL